MTTATEIAEKACHRAQTDQSPRQGAGRRRIQGDRRSCGRRRRDFLAWVRQVQGEGHTRTRGPESFDRRLHENCSREEVDFRPGEGPQRQPQ